VRLRDGRESTVSTSDLAPYPPAHYGNADPANIDSLPESDGVCGNDVEDVAADETDGVRFEKENDESSVPEDIASDSEPALPRRSTRRRKPPDRYGFNVTSIWSRENYFALDSEHQNHNPIYTKAIESWQPNQQDENMNYSNIAFILAQFWNTICFNLWLFQSETWDSSMSLFESLLQTF